MVMDAVRALQRHLPLALLRGYAVITRTVQHGWLSEYKQWGTYKGSKGFYTVTFPIAFSTLYAVVKSSAYRGSDLAGDERYIIWQSNTQFRLGCDEGGFNWIAVGQ